jgi:alanine-synthesizing transaminase
MKSLEFSTVLTEGAKVAVSPGIGFGPFGDEYVRFALVENRMRINQAIRGIRSFLSHGETVSAPAEDEVRSAAV